MQLFNKSLAWLISVINLVIITGCVSGTTSSGSTPVTPTESGVIFGNQQGLVYKNNTLLTGTLPVATIDYGSILTLILGNNGTMYVGTNAANGGHVFQYDPTSSVWFMLPNNLNSFLSVDGSSINSLVLDTSGNLYASTSSGNVFVYANNTWQQTGTSTSPLDNSAVNSLAIDSNNILYAGTQNGNVFKYSALAWQQLGTLSDGAIMALTIDSSNHVYAGTFNGRVAEYLNESWVQVNNCGSQVNSLVIDNTNNIIYAGTASGTVWKSGAPWVDLGTPDGTPINSVTLDNSSNLYAGTSGPLTGESSGQVYRYESSIWNQVSNLNFTYNNTGGLINTAAVQVVVINSNGTIYAGTNYPGNDYDNGGGLIFENSNSAESWQIVSSHSIDGTQVDSVAVDKNGSYYAGTDLGIYKYSNNSWTALIIPIAEIESGGLPQFYSIAFDNNGNVYGGSFNSGQIYEYIKQTESVIALPASPYSSANYMYQLAIDNNNGLYLAYSNISGSLSSPYVYKYIPDAGGESGVYESVGTNGPNESSNTSGVNGIVINSSNDIFVGSGNFVWKYPYNESSWVLVGTGGLDNGGTVSSLALDQQNNLYAATTNNNIVQGNVFEYINGSGLWTLIGNTLLNGITTVTIDSSNNIYVTSPPNNNGYPATVFMYSGGVFIPSYSGNYGELNINNGNAAGI